MFCYEELKQLKSSAGSVIVKSDMPFSNVFTQLIKRLFKKNLTNAVAMYFWLFCLHVYLKQNKP